MSLAIRYNNMRLKNTTKKLEKVKDKIQTYREHMKDIKHGFYLDFFKVGRKYWDNFEKLKIKETILESQHKLFKLNLEMKLRGAVQ